MGWGTALGQVGSVVGALGVGSVAGQFVGGSRDRRQSRAAVLAALSDVESARWVSGESTKGFIAAARDLQTAALIARLPRDPVHEYVALAQAAWWQSVADAEDNPGREFVGSVDGFLAEAVEAAARGIAGMAWSSRLRRRWIWRRTAKAIAANLERVQSLGAQRAVERTRKSSLI